MPTLGLFVLGSVPCQSPVMGNKDIPVGRFDDFLDAIVAQTVALKQILEYLAVPTGDAAA